MKNNLITIKEAAERVGVHQNTIRNWIQQNRLKAYRVGPRFIRINENELFELFERV